MTKQDCIQLIICVDHRIRYLRKALSGTQTSDSRQSKNDELVVLLSLERKLKEHLSKFPPY